MRHEDRRPIAAVAAIIVLVVVVVLLAGQNGSTPSPSAPPPTAVPVPPSAPATEQFGANVNRLFNDGTYTQAQIDAQLSALRATGATIARSDALWEASEPAPPQNGVHHYDWAFDDRIAASLARHGLRWLPIIDYSAPWAQSLGGHDHSPPSPTADYAAYAGALAARYGPGGAFWRAQPGLPALPVDTYEIWNEPDNPVFWFPAPDASRYALLYSSARATIDDADPSAHVLVGGLTNERAFLPAMLAADPALRGAIDGVAIHPYGPTPAAVLAHVVAARHVLDSVGLATAPLYVTEFGWTTSPAGALDGAPERLRPGYIEQTLALLGRSGCGIAAALLYTWVTPEHDPANAQDWFGISPAGGGASADVTAFSTGLRAAVRSAAGANCG